MMTTAAQALVKGSTIYSALIKASAELDVPATEVGYSIDNAQFFSETGAKQGLDEIEITAWHQPPLQAPELDVVFEWLKDLFTKMTIEAVVQQVIIEKGAESGGRAVYKVISEQGARIIGRKGRTIQSIRELLEKYAAEVAPGWSLRIDVDGGREQQRERSDSSRRDRDNGDRRDGKRRTSGRDKQRLERLGKKLARKVINSGEALVVNGEYNSFERRIIHLAVQSTDGVDSESFMDGDVKRIRIVLDAANEEVVSEEDSSDSSE